MESGTRTRGFFFTAENMTVIPFQWKCSMDHVSKTEVGFLAVELFDHFIVLSTKGTECTKLIEFSVYAFHYLTM